MPSVATQPVDANTLAWWAEEAHGRQGSTMHVYQDDGGNLVLAEQVPQGKQELFSVRAQAQRDPLRQARKISIQVEEGVQETNLLNNPDIPNCDALFWTASSIEKFLFPYYLSQRLYSQQVLCSKMTAYRNDPQLVAAAHRAPSRELAFRARDPIGFLRASDKGLDWIGLLDYKGG